ncbi:Polyphenol oxidase II, chloroplastic [Sesamum angolense]|uniref:Polyphenol oxidase II, chloroplastic n=1 Tax=Sesamum angolense TaxID=2727404 RepID=A0AAE1WRW1_9LAMI|nr:Polyphenol oxidase II, chloroplastic [Sesamum angolense]
MASLPLSCSSITPTTTTTRTFVTAPPGLSAHNATRTRRFNLSCKAKNGGDEQRETLGNEETFQGKFDRRNLLVGMGGLYGAANLVSAESSPAFASPISAPDLSKCTRGTNLNTQQPLDVNCCPPLSQKIIDYKLPPITKMRFRPAAHLASQEYIAKYEKAVELMKALPEDDPRSFMQQANVHCAYCNLTYEQTGDPSMRLQIHNSWHFFPWHRWYLYFYERILGKLIDDPTFGLPFWNWDNPPGMVMPNMFVKKDSPLFNPRRNQDHLPPAATDLNYAGKPTTDPSKIIPNNLTEMYSEMVRNVSTLEDFYGAKYVTGDKPDPGPGTVERGSHTALHVWVGQATPSGEDMGNFYSAGREPLFFSHHANVDRLWSIWRGLRGPKPKDFPESDWLNANFLFYDENAQLVRVKVADTLENQKMGFVWQEVDLPWLNNRPTARVKKSKVATTTAAPKATETVFPVKLDKVVKVLVDRPKKSRSKKDKEKEEELLVIDGIEVDTAKFVRFEVYINDEDDKADEIIDKAEYAGCYSQVPHKNSTKVKSKIRLGLTELLEDLDVEDDDKILVSLVPRAGGEDITIGGIKIIYAS